MKSKAPLLLMEQMVMLVVFALAAALCVQAFVRSDAASRRSQARDRAVVECQNAAEVIRHTGGNFNEAADELGLTFGQGSTMYCYYNENWEPIDYDTCGMEALPEAYLLSIHALLADEAPGLGKAHVSMSDVDGSVLFEIDVAFQREVGAYG